MEGKEGVSCNSCGKAKKAVGAPCCQKKKPFTCHKVKLYPPEKSPSLRLEKLVEDSKNKFAATEDYTPERCRREKGVAAALRHRFPGERPIDACAHKIKRSVDKDTKLGEKNRREQIGGGNSLSDNYNKRCFIPRKKDSHSSLSDIASDATDSELEWEDDENLAVQLQAVVKKGLNCHDPNTWKIKRKVLKAEKKYLHLKGVKPVKEKFSEIMSSVDETNLKTHLDFQGVINDYRKAKFTEVHKIMSILSHWLTILDIKVDSYSRMEDNAYGLCEAETLLNELELWKSNLVTSVDNLMAYADMKMKPIENILEALNDSMCKPDEKNEQFLKHVLKECVCLGWAGHDADVEGMKQIQIRLLASINHTKTLFNQAQDVMNFKKYLKSEDSQYSLTSVTDELEKDFSFKPKKEPFHLKFNPFYQFFK